MTVTSNQPEQRSQTRAALQAKLTLSGLDQELVACTQVLELDLAARGVEIMPLCRLDLVAVLRHDPVDVGGGRRHESRDRRPDRHPALRLAQCTPVDSCLN